MRDFLRPLWRLSSGPSNWGSTTAFRSQHCDNHTSYSCFSVCRPGINTACMPLRGVALLCGILSWSPFRRAAPSLLQCDPGGEEIWFLEFRVISQLAIGHHWSLFVIDVFAFANAQSMMHVPVPLTCLMTHSHPGHRLAPANRALGTIAFAHSLDVLLGYTADAYNLKFQWFEMQITSLEI